MVNRAVMGQKSKESESYGQITHNPALSVDIAYAISCVQDYQDSIDTDTEGGRKLRDNASRVINRLLSFYYQLTGYDPSREK
jgi:hypothetical protein